MKVIIDISPLKSKHKTRGIGIYTRMLVETLVKIGGKNQYILTTKADDIKDADLIHYPYFDLFFRTLPLKKRLKSIVTIHDVIPLALPELFPVGIRGSINFFFQRLALKSVRAIITDSHNSKRDIIRFLKIDPKRIHVIHLAASKDFRKSTPDAMDQARKKYKLPNSYLLYVGDVNPNKNIPRLIEAFSIVLKKFPNQHLLLVGRAFANKKLSEIRAIRRTIKNQGLRKKVLLRSAVPLDPSDDLAAIYSAADAYIQPSIYEGFGLPILEAFACETPVVTSQAASLPEVTGDAAIKINPHKPKSIADGVRKVLTLKSEEKRNLVAMGKAQAKLFSWTATAKKTMNVYGTVLKG
ncbi:MAG: hypothetical protein A3A65_04400 [Candidatus Chisholmbacteria bacterium RIFCSPLOWO2_01_FULL_49_14]|uniref:Glycosyl transferase family 1 domain-containing protein n=1 Tax=Candidatus Chisholmbacteria bacterium RIFCSPLOWO2_01_FULL_49_14 TaxID=1797593 RepID=A0A1G1W3X4_9BACT|nr:MAG: hypothetical protein A3A65_04400 [Candidatus Chisholmbacteria bacterium RIFCSPLOWO2_01_FULL_49_14]